MKKFSKLILEKKEEKYKRHPCINQEDWNNIILPLIEHISGSESTSGVGVELFRPNTISNLDKLINSITEDYVRYYQNMVEPDIKNLFELFEINIDPEDLKDCLVSFTDRTENIDEIINYDLGFYYLCFNVMNYETMNELILDVEDVFSKLKLYKVNFKMKVETNNDKIVIEDSTNESLISKSIKNALELPGQDPKNWIDGLDRIQIFFINNQTCRADYI